MWGFASAMCLNTNCCFDTRCSRIIEQDKIIIKLHEQINKLTKLSECNSYKDILTTTQCYLLSKRIYEIYFLTDTPFIFDISPEMTKFYTITFSPQRFYQHTDQQYMDYIMFHLSEMYVNDKLIWFAYGCFENHKSGVIHAHVAISSNNHDLVNKYLNQKFNHDARNRRCIDSSYIKSVEKVINYINKESTNYFRIGRQIINNKKPD